MARTCIQQLLVLPIQEFLSKVKQPWFLINTTLSDNGTYENRVATAKTSKYINLIVIIQGMYTITAVSFRAHFLT